MQHHVQIAIIKLEKVIENSEISFGTSGRDIIAQVFEADDDITYIIDNYETTKVEFCDAVGKLESSQQNTGQQYKWSIVSLIIENLAQHRGGQAKKDTKAEESYGNQEDEANVDESDPQDRNADVGEDDDTDDDDEASLLGGKRNRKVIDTIQKDFAFTNEIVVLIMRKESVTSAVARYMITAVGKGREYLYRLRTYVRSLKTPPWVKIFFSWLKKLMEKYKLVNVCVRIFGSILAVIYYMFLFIVFPILRPRRTIMRIIRWFWGPSETPPEGDEGGEGGVGSDSGVGGDSSDNGAVPVPPPRI